MGALLAPDPMFRAYDNNNNPLAGGQLYTYQAGTTTPVATYTDSTGGTPNSNPVVLNARGEAPVWLSPTQAYKLVLKDANGNTIWTVDQVTSPAPVAVGNMTDEKGSNGLPGFSAANGDFTPGTTTSLTLSTNYGSASNLWVAFDAAEQGGDTFTLSGTTLTFNAPIPTGTNKVYVKGGTALSVGIPGSSSVTDSSVALGSKLYNRINDIFDIRDYGGKGDNSTDNTAALNAAAIAAGNNGILYFPAGTYLFKSKPNDITSPLYMKGAGINVTTLVRSYSEIGATTGFLNISANGGSGCVIEDFEIVGASGTSGGSLIQGLSTSTTNLVINLRRLWLSTFGTNTQNYDLVLDGTAKVGGAQGLRDSLLSDIWCFGAATDAVLFKDVEGLCWNGGGLFPAGGASGDIVIDGTAANGGSNNVNISLASVPNIILIRCNAVQIASPIITGSIQNNSLATNCLVVGGTPAAGVQNNWQNSMYVVPGVGYTKGGTQQINQLPNGKFEVTGILTFAGGTSAAVTFPSAFTNQVESISFSPNGNTNVYYSGLTLSGVTVNTPSAFTGSIFYRVSGN